MEQTRRLLVAVLYGVSFTAQGAGNLILRIFYTPNSILLVSIAAWNFWGEQVT